MAYLLVSFWLNFCYEWILPFSLFNHRRVWVGRDPEASWCHQQSWLVAVLQQKGFPRAISFRKNILAMLSESHLHHGFPEGCYRNLYVSILINILKEVLWVVGCALSKSSIGSRDNTGMTMKQLLLPASSSPPIHPSPCFYSTHHWEIWVLTRCAVSLLSEQRPFVHINSILFSNTSFSPNLETRLSSKPVFFSPYNCICLFGSSSQQPLLG